MSPLAAAFVAVGACAGTAARFLLSHRFARTPPSRARFPVGTLLVNLTGSFILGVLIGLAATPVVGVVHMLALGGTGFCGALTTMSTLSLEVVELLRQRRWLLAGGYLVVSVTGGVLLFLVGARGVAALV